MLSTIALCSKMSNLSMLDNGKTDPVDYPGPDPDTVSLKL